MKLEEMVNQNYQSLNENDMYIWDYISHHKKECEQLSIDELASRTHVSRSTVLRFAKRIGLKGYSELKVFLRIDNMSANKISMIDNVYKRYIQSIERLKDYQYEDIVTQMYDAKNLFVYGTGDCQSHAAGHLKRAFAMTGRVCIDIEAANELEGYIHLFEKDDVFIAISFHGENSRLLDFIYRLKTKGVCIIAILVSNDSTLAHIADYCLKVPVLSIMTNQEKRGYLLGQYFILIDFLVTNYIEYAIKREKE